MKILGEGGFEAYLVGGGVRDLLLEGRPKDFDVATDATPEQIKKLFRNARIIGRRFKIVHVRFGREVIEVTTFRGNHDDADNSRQSVKSDEGMLLRDNVYGDIQSDALRRDFTINALYYTLNEFTLHDFTGGIDDIRAGKIRMIGDARTRYQEDPVRMLRAVRFAGKLGFSIEESTRDPIFELGSLLNNIPPARRFEEYLKLFMGGYGSAVLPLLIEHQLLQYLFPATHEVLEQDPNGKTRELLTIALNSTDRRIANEQPVTPAFLVAAFLWQPLVQRQELLRQQDQLPPVQAFQQAAQSLLSEQVQSTAIPKRFTQTARDIWDLQDKLQKRQGKRAFRTLEHPRFRAAYDFLVMREQSGEDLQGLGEWWTRFQQVNEDERNAMIAGLQPSRRRSRPRKRRSSQADS